MRKAAEILKEMDAIVARAEHEKRDMTEAEATEFDTLQIEFDAARAAESEAEGRRTQETQSRREALAAAHADVERSRAAARRQAPIARAGGEPAVREFENFGEFACAVRFQRNDPRLEFHQFDEPRAEQRMDDGPTGGFLVPQQFRASIYEAASQGSIVRSRATVLPAGSPPDAKITFPALDQRASVGSGNMFGGVQVGYVAGEGGLKPSTTANFREISIEPVEWAGLVTVTDKLLRNYAAAAVLLTRLLGTAARAFEDTKFLRGTGSGQPLGALVAGARYVVARETASQFGFADYKNMMARRNPEGGSYAWVVTLEAMPQVMSLRNLEGSPAIGDGALLFQAGANGAPDTLGGIPIVWSARSPALGEEADVALCDFAEYYIKDGSGPFIAASEHVYFANNKTVIKIFANHDAQPALTEPLSLENGYQVSPFIVLGA
jgi:HK97 family phage major capsid protein